MSAPTNGDWEAMLRKSWEDADFRELLETNPTQAIQDWAAENNKSYDKLLTLVENEQQFRQYCNYGVAQVEEPLYTCC